MLGPIHNRVQELNSQGKYEISAPGYAVMSLLEKPDHNGSATDWSIRLKLRLDELGWKARDLNRQIGGDHRSHQSIIKYLRGEILHPRGNRIARIAQAINMTVPELLYGVPPSADVTVKTTAVVPIEEARTGKEGYFVDINKEPTGIGMAYECISEGMNTEAWRLNTDCISAEGYVRNDLLVVDMDASPQPGDVALAMVRDKTTHAEPVFRVVEPPYLICSALQRVNRKPILIDNDRAIVRGIVIASIRITKRA